MQTGQILGSLSFNATLTKEDEEMSKKVHNHFSTKSSGCEFKRNREQKKKENPQIKYITSENKIIKIGGKEL
ncbi:hypothetical protein PHJA_002508900 [Phtheirospermum japonicum]|uniref:Uncharacterized protein n=1 Tax=Phtheirospermum japonicum TaxID=374723 RepID=A0A830CUT4_9LAMI|nr:hypothetical protein PHJA_002508900 [Phtheirospermum japonicum]